MNTKHVEDKDERRKLKRTARKEGGSEAEESRKRGARFGEAQSQEDFKGSDA